MRYSVQGRCTCTCACACLKHNCNRCKVNSRSDDVDSNAAQLSGNSEQKNST